jgi:hypothetical protein
MFHIGNYILPLRDYSIYALAFNLNCDFAPTFFYLAFLPLLFKHEGVVYPNL